MSTPPTPPRQHDAASAQQQHWQQPACSIVALKNTAQWADGHPDLPAALKKQAVSAFLDRRSKHNIPALVEAFELDPTNFIE